MYLELSSSSVPQIINNNLVCDNVVGCLPRTENVSLDSLKIFKKTMLCCIGDCFLFSVYTVLAKKNLIL